MNRDKLNLAKYSLAYPGEGCARNRGAKGKEKFQSGNAASRRSGTQAFLRRLEARRCLGSASVKSWGAFWKRPCIPFNQLLIDSAEAVLCGRISSVANPFRLMQDS